MPDYQDDPSGAMDRTEGKMGRPCDSADPIQTPWSAAFADASVRFDRDPLEARLELDQQHNHNNIGAEDGRQEPADQR
jgi:hypothetical protein